VGGWGGVRYRRRAGGEDGWGGVERKAPPGVPEKYRKKRIKISTRRLFVPGVPILVRKSTRPTCIHLEKKALLDLP